MRLGSIGAGTMRGESRHALLLLKEKAPSARLFRAFSSLGWEKLADPDFGGARAGLFFCGDEEERATVEGLMSDVGLEPVYLGGIDQVGLVEDRTDMRFALAMRRKLGRRIASKVPGV